MIEEEFDDRVGFGFMSSLDSILPDLITTDLRVHTPKCAPYKDHNRYDQMIQFHTFPFKNIK